MDEVVMKYPWADAKQIQKLWQEYQYTDKKAHKSFLEYYEKITNPTLN